MNIVFILGVGVGCENEIIDQGRSYYIKNINISNCYFSRLSAIVDTNGGVIAVWGSSYSMIINFYMFYNCASGNSGDGGAIYFYSTNSSLIMICANRCSCASDSYSGNFAILSASQVNHVEYLSVTHSSPTKLGRKSIYLIMGNQRMDNTNSSMNNAREASGVYIESPSSFTSSHCTFSNNQVSSHQCLYLSSSTGTISIDFTNIVHNNSPYDGVVSSGGTVSKNLMFCVFKNNSDHLFCVYSGSLDISHSFIIHSSSSFSTRTSVSTIINNTNTTTNTYQLQFFNSFHCNADIPIPQRTFDKSPERTLDETISSTKEETLRMTFRRTIDQTIIESPINTLDQTIRETLKETIHRSYAECIFSCQIANRKQMNVIFSLSFIYPIVMIMN